jgi:hypothetical protein
VAVAAGQHDRQVGPAAADFAGQIDALHARHHDVGEDQAEGIAALFKKWRNTLPPGDNRKSEAADPQFWALEHPLSPGFAARYGIPPATVGKFDLIEIANLKSGSRFKTRPAPGTGSNPGRGIKVVVPPKGINLNNSG